MAERGLAVLLDGVPVAELYRTRNGVLRLTYQQEARRPGSTPLSLALPLDQAEHSGARVETFLGGLVPENPGALAAIARRHRVDTTDVLAVLGVIGLDCAGAVQFCRPEDLDTALARSGSLEPITDGEIEARLDEFDTDEDASWTMPGEHWSLGGTQQKFALRREDERWFQAHGAQPTTHILKPGVRRMRAQALVEHASMRVAAELGLDVAATTFTEFHSRSAIVVERFDRRRVGDRLVRLHQEDLCQALGVAEKYEEYGGPGALEAIRLLRDAAATAAEARENVRRFVDGLVFNTVIGAPDAHARNTAVLLEGDSVRIAPMYDVATGFGHALTGGGRRRVSMSVGGSFDLEAIDDQAWLRFAEQADLDPETILERVRNWTESAPATFDRVLSALDVDDAPDLRTRILAEFAARH